MPPTYYYLIRLSRLDWLKNGNDTLAITVQKACNLGIQVIESIALYLCKYSNVVVVEYKSAKAEIGKIPNCESVLKVPKHLWCLLNCASNDHPMSTYLRFFHKFAAPRTDRIFETWRALRKIEKISLTT